MTVRGFTLVGLLSGVFVLAASPASAERLSPWFHVSSVSRPGNLFAGRGHDEVQVVHVIAEEGEFVLVEPVALENEEFKFTVLPVTATAQEVQEGLETVYGAGNVAVSEIAPRTFRVTFQGSLADQPLKPMLAFGAPTTVTEQVKGTSDGQIVVAAVNVGDGDAVGASTPLSIAEVLPGGLRAVSIAGFAGANESEASRIGEVHCVLATLTCSFEGSLPPFEQIEVHIGVAVQPGAVSGERYEARLSGAAAPLVRYSHQVTIDGAPTPFGVEDYSLSSEEVGGGEDTQAGSHPFQSTFTFDFNQVLDGTGKPLPAGGLPKDLVFKLPPGLIGNPTAYPRCTIAQFSEVGNGGNKCPADSVLGVAVTTFYDSGVLGLTTAALPIFNLVPDAGEPARFGFQPGQVPVYIRTSVRTGGDYGVTAHVDNIPQTIDFLNNSVTFWGVPGDPRHATARGYGCLEQPRNPEPKIPCEPGRSSEPPPAFMSLPTSCTGELETSVETESWTDPHPATPHVYKPNQFETPMGALDGCGLLPFASEIGAASDVQSASSPSGVRVDVHVPQSDALNPEGLAPAEVRNITVALPEGMQLNPSAADGLQACTQEQVGLSRASDATCPDASKIATATITTPLLPDPLKGFVYLAAPQNFASPPNPLENPFGSLVAMYLVAADPASGTLVKLPGRVFLSPTGRVTASFSDNPQLPFEDAEVAFFGGARAPLATPPRCRAYTTEAEFEPWSNTETHHEILASRSQLEITSGPGGSPCPGSSLPFAPSLAAESLSVNAGSFTPLSTTLSRHDGQQPIQSVTLHYPPGLSGVLAGIPLCPEEEANAGTCPAASQIGETTVSVGVGGDPFSVTGGKVYLTEKYHGAPFGLSIVNPAKAGPFDLQEGRPVIVRAKIEVDPHTAALTISSNAIPTIIEGFPLQIQHVNVLINRTGFTFNPTNCTPTAISGFVNSSEGASAPVSVRFQVTNCAALKFAPKFSVSTSAHTSKAKGANLVTKLSEPPGALGAQANIREVKVDLPKQLPSQLKTLQKACLARVFAANHAACPAESVVGHATVTTPLLPVPLTGPAYFVSHGGEAFPSLTLVLQGYGVTVELVGSTFIKNGITSSTFKSTPDVPFNSFELTLPQGKYAALGANLPARAKDSFCGQHLRMPTLFVAQNGLEIHQNTPIKVTGCAKKRKHSHKHQTQPARKRK